MSDWNYLEFTGMPSWEGRDEVGPGSAAGLPLGSGLPRRDREERRDAGLMDLGPSRGMRELVCAQLSDQEGSGREFSEF